MKKILLSICAIMVLSISALAQEIHYGVYAGGSINKINIGS